MLSLSSILEGSVIGVTISLVVGIYLWAARWCRRREQISYMRAIVSKGIKNIKEAQEIAHPGKKIPRDNIRILIFERLITDIESALEYRMTELDYGKIYDLRKIVTDVSDMMNSLGLGSENGKVPPEGMNLYDQFIDKVEKLEWLGLR